MTKNSSTFSLRQIRAFAHQHDDLPAFHAAYLVLTVLAAALFNLGLFALIILAHMGLDVFKYREVHGLGWRRTVEGVVRESMLDVTLFLMGLVVAVYLHPSVTGLAGIKGMMLAEVTVLRGVGLLAPKLKILYEMIKILSDIEHYLSRMHPKMGKRAGMVEYVCSLSILITVGMLLLAPILLMVSGPEYAYILMDELTPWKI